jgi:gamma-glutamyl hercynylcysteine S-oxide synthase
MSSPEIVSDARTRTEAVLDRLDEAREQPLALVSFLTDEQLERSYSPLMSPLEWDLGHIAAYEELWLVHRLGGEPLSHPELAARYDAFETPRRQRVDIDYLRGDERRAYMKDVRDRVYELAYRDGIGDGLLHELVLRHERQHDETMLQTLNLARVAGWRPGGGIAGRITGGFGKRWSGLDLVQVPAGEFVLGAEPDGFAYDNERPRHEVDVPAFAIGRTAVTNGDWLEFVRRGGYERREWWSEEGWVWREREKARQPLNWIGDALEGDPREWRLLGDEPLDASKPVVHVSWYEADAFARACGLRLPTEIEWEKAASWDAAAGRKLSFPWGEAEPDQTRANLVEQRIYGTAAADSDPDGAAPCGALNMIGNVWEWTSNHFNGYDGFAAHPYREYSEVFFGDSYRVLRGGSWATSREVATPTFRNWDLPQRRQIFAGLRLASDD